MSKENSSLPSIVGGGKLYIYMIPALYSAPKAPGHQASGIGHPLPLSRLDFPPNRL
jgi:hypothetical protein